MAEITWPSTLPQAFETNSYQETMPDNLIRDPNDIGPQTLRRRVTATFYTVKGSIMVTTEEWETLKGFLAEETLHRALPFGFPSQGGSAEGEWLVLLSQPPVRSAAGGDKWMVQLEMIVLP